jgi:hypothetical protein
MQQAPTNGHRRLLPADQCGTKRGDRVPPGGRWLARSHRQRADGALLPEVRGVLETDNGAVILFECQVLAVLDGSSMRQLLGSLVLTTDDPRYRWLNDRVCAVEGEVRPRADGSGFDVVLEVSEMVWEGLA